jgi:polysaccharide biosynthesis protein PslH
MHLLIISPWCPYPADNGSKLRIFHLLRGLSNRHTLDLIAFCPDAPIQQATQELCQFCRSVSLLPETPFAGRRLGRAVGLLSAQPRSMAGNFSSAMVALVERTISQHRYSALMCAQLHMVPYALRTCGVPIIFEELELAMLADTACSGRLRAGLTWWKTRHYVAAAMRRCAGATVVSATEERLARQIAPPGMPLAVVPNGVNIAALAGNFGSPEPNTLIYPGALSYDANHDAMVYFLSAIFPLIRHECPNVRLRVTGRATPAQIAALPNTEGVEFTGYIDDVRPAVAGSWAEVVPLRKGGGTRLKVLEALALGTPVISTSKGVEGLALQPGRDVLVADTPADFAAQTLRLLRSPALRADMAAHGRRAVASYDWSQSVARLEELIMQAVGAESPV